MLQVKKYLIDARRRLAALDCTVRHCRNMIEILTKTGMPSSHNTTTGVRSGGVSDPTYLIVVRLEKERKKRDAALREYAALADELFDLFSVLPPHLRAAMELYYIAGMRWENVAEKCNISPRGVYQRRDRAIKILSGKC